MPPNKAANDDQIAYWNDEAGRTWAEMQEALDRQLEPLGLRVMKTLAPREGERLIDVGCGCGQTTLTLADRVGASGAVSGVDISQPMLEVARARARAAGVVQASFVEADAQLHPFEAGAFDAVFSRFGVMFFADPQAAFANLRRALRPGGRLAFICWRSPAENPWMTAPVAAALRHLPPPPPPPPGAPDPFAFGDADWTRSVLAGAGFEEITIEPHDAPIGGNSLEQTVGLALRLGPLGRLLDQHPQARDAVIEDIRAIFIPYLREGVVVTPSSAWIVSAKNGGR